MMIVFLKYDPYVTSMFSPGNSQVLQLTVQVIKNILYITHSASLVLACVLTPKAASPLHNSILQEFIITANNLQEVILWCEKHNYHPVSRDLHLKHLQLWAVILFTVSHSSEFFHLHLHTLLVCPPHFEWYVSGVLLLRAWHIVMRK